MQKIVSMLFVLLLLLLAACGNSQSKITQAGAESIVVQDLTENFSKDKDKIKKKICQQRLGEVHR
ncbi:hypothetical protein [Bacillus suaedae]|uniref:Uncharacterized protein n=1 Tax=Halalkalibacter suaedae TaxID=2822140 RepID=A0A941APT6_9BACI|nr:hypothetical protein [Bacillus suaedae]MBP3953125.1 hypothetical protein [Bacillus suaedae]